jgi:hypothetical protein
VGAGVNAFLMRAAIALTRAWVRVYTSRLPSDVAEMRRTEIDSDIWEMQHDSDLRPGLPTTTMALVRLIGGMPDDIAWHVENASTEEQMRTRLTVALTAATVLVLSLWSVPSFNRPLEAAPCAAALPQVAASLQLEVIKCVGSFFSMQSPKSP